MYICIYVYLYIYIYIFLYIYNWNTDAGAHDEHVRRAAAREAESMLVIGPFQGLRRIDVT